MAIGLDGWNIGQDEMFAQLSPTISNCDEAEQGGKGGKKLGPSVVRPRSFTLLCIFPIIADN